MDLLCEAQIPERWAKARAKCKSGINHWLLVSAIGSFNFRDRTAIDGMWHNVAPGWPLCDIGANDWTITQTGRNVTGRWRNGTGGSQVGTFKGVLVTGDKPKDDRVAGEYTINDHGTKVSGGAMTFALSGDTDRFDFNGTGVPGGTMARNDRSTESASAPHRCSKPASTPTTTFTLTNTKVTNPRGPEMTVDATGGKIIWNHTGQYGGEGKGGEWKVDCTFKVPQTMTAGKSFSIKLGLAVSDVVPIQPLLMEMSARAPGLLDHVSVNYPISTSASKTFSVPLSAGYKDVKDIVVIVGCFGNTEITFTYHSAGS